MELDCMTCKPPPVLLAELLLSTQPATVIWRTEPAVVDETMDTAPPELPAAFEKKTLALSV